jgi:hypothetical protein
MIPIPFPRDAVRDLLGITRALFRAERSKPTPDPSRLARLQDAGTRYREALDMGSKYASDTMGGRAALSKAEAATITLGELVAESDMMVGAVVATGQRLRRVR